MLMRHFIRGTWILMRWPDSLDIGISLSGDRCISVVSRQYPPPGLTHTHRPVQGTWYQIYSPLQWPDKHLWKHYLPANSLVGGNNVLECCLNASVRGRISHSTFRFWTQPIVKLAVYHTKILLPPAVKLRQGNIYRPQWSCEGYVFTCVCLSTGGGSTLAGTPQDQVHPRDQVQPPDQVHPRDRVHPPDQVHPWTRYTSPLDQVHPPGPGTQPPQTRYTPQDHPLDQVHPPGPGTPLRTRYTHQDQVHPTRRQLLLQTVCILLYAFLFHRCLSVILFTRGGGVCLSACWDTHPPTGTPPGRYTHPVGQVHPHRDCSGQYASWNAFLFSSRYFMICIITTREGCFHRCLSVHGGGGWGCLPLVPGEVCQTLPPLGRHPPPGQTPLLGQTHTPCAVHAGIRSTSGRYASHWNAFLLRLCMP